MKNKKKLTRREFIKETTTVGSGVIILGPVAIANAQKTEPYEHYSSWGTVYKNPSASLVVRIGDSYWSFKEEISKDPIDNRLIEVAKYINGGFVPESGDLEKKFREQYEAERKGFVGHYTDLFKQKADKGLLSEFSAHRGVMGECKGDTDEDWWSSCHINATTLVKEPKTGKYCIISARDNAANGTTDKFSVDLIVKRSFFNEERKKIINMMYDNSPFGRDTIGELCSYAEARRPTRR